MPDKPVIGAIELTPDEAALCASIEFDQGKLNHETAEANGEAVCRLMHMLVQRNAIPEARRKVFQDADHRRGRPKGSRQNLFERNGTRGDEILKHPNFLADMRYFVFGAQLPQAVLDEFVSRANRFGHVGPSDALELGDLARKLTRDHGLKSHDVDEEFFKLAIDCGIYVTHAHVIRKRVHDLRSPP